MTSHLICHLFLSQFNFAILFLPDLPNALLLIPAIVLVALAVGINLLKSAKGAAVFKTPFARISLVVLAQIIILGGFQTKYQSVIDSGLPIVLESNPVDPYDLFRGNYQSLRFDITNLNRVNVPFHFSAGPNIGDVVFVTLKQSKDVWVASGIYNQKPNVKDGPFIKGQLTYVAQTNVYVHYGIEQYFYPDSQPITIPNGALASVKVDANGDAVLTGLVAKKTENQQKRKDRAVFDWSGK